MWHYMRTWLQRFWFARREAFVLRECGCTCLCPGCGDILNDQAFVEGVEGDEVIYRCQCGTLSRWDFRAPVPLLLGAAPPVR